MTEPEKYIENLVRKIQPWDAIEKDQQEDALAWIRSGAPLFRITKPDIPPKHLVSYFVPFDPTQQKIMLIDHILAQQWLAPGGHIEPNEDPAVTVRREAGEELGIEAQFLPKVGDQPFFISVRETVGLTAGHTDVSLWYVILADAHQDYTFDRSEFTAYRWFDFETLRSMPLAELDPHLPRFVSKLQNYL